MKHEGNRNLAIRLSFIVFSISFLWILFSDRLAALITNDPTLLTHIQTYKGWFYITSISVIIYLIIRKDLYKQQLLFSQLEDSRNSYRLLINHLPGVDTFLFNPAGEVILANTPLLDKHQFLTQNKLTTNVNDCLNQKALQEAFQELFKAVSLKQNLELELQLGDLHLFISAIPILADTAQLTGGIIIIKDITQHHNILKEIALKSDKYEGLYQEYLALTEELKAVNKQLLQANNELSQNEEKYRLFFENINDAAFIYQLADKPDGSDGLFLEINNNLLVELGYDREELVKSSISSLFLHSEEITEALATLQKSRRSMKIDTLLKSVDGNGVPFEISFYLIQLNQKSVLLAIARNTTERIKFIEELMLEKQKSEGANKLKEAFLANLSHEIRTPLNGILGFSRILDSTDLSRIKIDKYISIIKDSSNQLLNIINDIIDLSKIETGQLTLFTEQIKLNDFLNSLLEYGHEKLLEANKSLEFTAKLATPETEMVRVDVTKLRRIAQILIDNAVKFTDEGNIHLQCSVESSRSLLHFSLSDTGIGIAEDKIEHIFDNFTQGDGSSSRDYGGNGVGLAIARGLVNFMGGKIEVESIPGRGARFDYYIPYYQ